MHDSLSPSIVARLLRHAAWTRRAALDAVRDPQLAEDLTQEAFLRVLQTRAQPGPAWRPWYRRVLENLARNRASSDRSRDLRERAVARASDVACDLPSDADVVARAEILGVVQQEVMGLPQPYRRVLLLCFFEDRSAVEIARSDGTPDATVRSQMRRGLELLRERLIARLGPADRWRGIIVPALPALPASLAVDAGVPSSIGWGEWGGIAMASTGAVTKTVGVIAVAIAVCAVLMFTTREPDATFEPRAAMLPAPIDAEPDPAVAEPEPLIEPASVVREAPPEPPRRVLEPLPQQAQPGDSRIRGRVVAAATGAPVAGAEVSVATPWGVLHGRTTTDESGAFALSSLDLRSTTDLRVLATGFAPMMQGIDDAPSLRTGEDGAMEIGTIALETGESIEGIVRLASGEPAAGARIFVAGEFHDVPKFIPAFARTVGVADALGHFALRGVRSTEGTNTRKIYAVASPDSGDAGSGGGVELRLPRGSGGSKGVEIRLAAPCVLNVRVVDREHAPIANAIVTAEPRFEPWIDFSYQQTERGFEGPQPVHGMDLGSSRDLVDLFRSRSDAAGVVRLARLPSSPAGGGPGCYDLVVESTGHRAAFVDDVKLAQGESREIEFVLESPRLHRIEGIVYDPDGDAVAGTDVGLTRVRSGNQFDRYPKATTDETGHFVFDALPSGDRFQVSARPPEGCMPRSVDVDLTDRAAPDTIAIEIRCVRAYTIRGRLVDQDGNGIPQRFLGIVPDQPNRSLERITKTDASGAFELWTPVAGEQVVRGVNFGFPQGYFQDPSVEWTVKGGAQDVRLVAAVAQRGGCALHVDVRDALDGRPLELESALLQPVPADADRRAPRPELAIGKADFAALAAGDWSLTLSMRGRGDVVRTLAIPQDRRDESLRVLVPRPSLVHVRVAFPPKMERVCRVRGDRRLLDATGQDIGVLEVPAGGVGEFLAQPGVIELEIMTRNVVGSRRVEVKEGDTIEVTIDATIGATLRTSGCVDLEPGTVTLEVAESGGDWSVAATHAFSGSAMRGEIDATVIAGKGRWRVSHAPSAAGAAASVIAEGDYDVAAEETRTLTLPAK